MGCCASRPENEHGNGNSEQPAAIQDMTTAPRLPGPPQIFRELSNRPASSSNSVATSTAHQPVALNEHYNEPLRTHVWRTKANKRPWSYAKWKRMREEFFETQVTNRAEVWASLKAVVELLDDGEVETAQGIINASEITLPTGDLVDGAYDSFGNLYRLPPFAVSAPENMTENDEITDSKTPETGRGADTAQNNSLYPSSSNMPDAEKSQIVSETAKDLVSVKARLSDRGGNGQDVTVKIGSQDSTKVLISLVAEKAGVPAEKIKIAYMGKILKSNKGLVAQGWQAGHVVNAMVLP